MPVSHQNSQSSKEIAADISVILGSSVVFFIYSKVVVQLLAILQIQSSAFDFLYVCFLRF